jgi:hypothetical protein
MPAVIHKRFWDIVGDRMMEEILQVLMVVLSRLNGMKLSLLSSPR